MFFLAMLLTLAYGAFRWYLQGVTVGGDGRNYLLQGKGENLPAPFTYRRVYSYLMGVNPLRWQITTYIALLLTPTAIFWTATGYDLNPLKALICVVLWVGLYGVFAVNIKEPVRPDATAILFMVLSVGAFVHGYMLLGITDALLASLCKETSPLFIAACGYPWALVGLVAPLTLKLLPNRKPYTSLVASNPLFTKPLQTVRDIRIKDMTSNWQQYLAPWGVVLVLALLHPALSVFLSLALGYGQLLLATDSSRLYQFGFLPLILVSAQYMPLDWACVLCAIHLFQPFHGMKK